MRWSQIISEGVNKYLPMFNAFIPLLGKDEIVSTIRDIENAFKREDRVIYALRYHRLSDAVKVFDAGKIDEKAFTKITGGMSRSAAYEAASHYFSLEHTLRHMCQLTMVPKIEAVVWQKQTPADLVRELKALEDEWKTAQSQKIAHTGSEDLFLEVDHEWAWYDLNTASCDKEAKAMGHCGNAGSSYGETVLSLRRHLGNNIYRPSLTFILDDDGYLGEMKGRGNEKPAERYHAAIVKLLRDPRITGIKGGGYLPHHNFKLGDLKDDDLKAELKQEKPELGDALDLYDAYKAGDHDEALVARLKKAIEGDLKGRHLSYKSVDLKKDEIIIDHYKNYKDYHNYYSSYTTQLSEFFDHLGTDLVNDYNLPHDAAQSIAHAARSQHFAGLFSQLLHYDVNYTLEGVQPQLNQDGSIDIVYDLGSYFDNFWAPEDEGYTRIESLDDVNEYSGSDLSYNDWGDDIDNMIVSYLEELMSDRASSMRGRDGYQTYTTRNGETKGGYVRPSVDIRPVVKAIYKAYYHARHDSFTDDGFPRTRYLNKGRGEQQELDV